MQYSIVKLKEIQNSAFGNRIDAEFYLPEYIDVDAEINEVGFEPLIQLTSKIDVGHVGPMAAEYTSDGVWLLQTQNVQEFFLSEASQTRINAEFHHYLAKSKVRNGDILIARSGSFGKASIYLEDEEINSADIIIIRCIEKRVNPFYLVAFLNCKFGTNQLLRYASGGVQGHVNLTILENLKVCSLSAGFQEHIESICRRSYLTKQRSEQLYSQAQTILLSELGLIDWQPRHRLTFVKNYADIQRADRIDAEYFQPKYEEIEETICSYPGGYSLIQEEFNQNKSTFEIDRDGLYRYVEIGSVNVSTGEIIVNQLLGKDLPTNAKRPLKRGDVIVSKVRTYRGAVAIVDQDDYVGSGAFCVLRENGQINKETLLAFLHSRPLLAWSLKPNTGTSYPVIVDDDILNLPIPILPEDKQAQIKRNVNESFNLRKQSKHLLECAKHAVEIAIEQDEQTSTEWLRSETQLQENSHVNNGEKLPAILVPADIFNAATFPETWKEFVNPVVDAMVTLSGIASRSQLITQLIGKLRLPPYTDDDYWEGVAPAHRAPLRKRRDLFENRLGSALQILRKQGRIKSQGGKWHLQT